MKAQTKERLLDISPNVKSVIKLISKVRIKRINSYIIPQSDIKSGEENEANKEAIVKKYLSQNWLGLKKTAKIADRVLSNAFDELKDQNTKKIKNDMLFCRLAYGFEPDEYLCFGFKDQSVVQRKEWISDLDRYRYIFAMNDIKAAQVFNNKARTYEMFGKYYGRQAISIKSKSDYPAYKEFLKTHKKFVKKQVSEGMGRSVELVKTNEISPKEYFDILLSNGEHILEELILQDEVMSNLNESSVNTIRCITMLTRKGVVIPYTFLKVGRSGSFVDNGGAGGILAGINVDTGVIDTNGYDEFATEYIKHPDSGVTFNGYSFPKWEEMKKMCMNLAKKIQNVKCIGWDVTLSDKGWIIVEGNGMTQFIGPQIVYKRGIKKEVLDVLKNMDLICDIPDVKK